MCGIAGIIVRPGEVPETNVLKKMLTAIAHRGPDNEGTYSFENISLGHRRLSIIELTDIGNQPMHYHQFSIIYNGEIYNYLELRQELLTLGHEFQSKSDTEVILHAYEEWGVACLQRFIGMWAFMIVDKRENIAFCARDRFGIKPFYFFEDESRFMFASEIKALLAANVRAKVNIELLMIYLVVGFSDHSARTFFQGIDQLSPGHYMLIDCKSGSKELVQYYDLSWIGKNDSTIDNLATCFQDSIRLHLRSDVKLGTCLSGGLDSSTVAAMASRLSAQQTGSRFGAVTAQSEYPLNDESEFANEVRKHCHLDWHLVKPTYDDFANDIEESLRFQDEPTGGPSVFMQYYVMKAAKDVGFKVMLDGQGGDETLLGYERYYPAFFWYLCSRGKWLNLLKEYYLATRNSKLNVTQLTGYTAYFLFMPLRKQYLARRVRFLKTDHVRIALDCIGTLSQSFFNIAKLQPEELTKYQLPNLLRYEDRNSMAHSIEARVPLVEHRYVEAAFLLDPSSKIRNGYTKYAFRQIADPLLPKTIVWRKSKIGFEAPTRMWLNKHLLIMQEKVNDSVLLKSICRQVPNLERLSLIIQWRLYNIAVWESQYNVSM